MGRNQIRSEFTWICSDSARTPTIPLGFLPFHSECVGEGKVLAIYYTITSVVVSVIKKERQRLLLGCGHSV